MKYLLLLPACLLVGCASAYRTMPKSETSKIDFNISAGRYEEFQLETWHKGDSVCAGFSIQQPHNSTQWVASAMLYLAGKKKTDVSRIMLFTPQTDSKSLAMGFKHKGDPDQIFANKIPFRKMVRFEATFPDDHTVRIRANGSEYRFPIGYDVQDVQLGASSAEATIEILPTQVCENPGRG